MNESRAKEELHNRLERMVADVEAVINSQDLPDIQPPAELELDEVYVTIMHCICMHLSNRALDFARSSKALLTNMSFVSYSSTLFCEPRNWRYSTKWPASSNNASNKKLNPPNLIS